MASTVFVVGLSLISAAAAQTPAQGTVKLALDSTKPIVYIAFDHAARRGPVEAGEPDRGLWLRLVNNSVLAVEVRANGTATDPEMTILPDILVPRPTHFLGSPPVQERMPRGYSSNLGSLITIDSGKSLIFSVPVNHVSRMWSLQIPFHFSLPPVKEGVQPICLVEFVWENIPERYRTGSAQQLETPPPR